MLSVGEAELEDSGEALPISLAEVTEKGTGGGWDSPWDADGSVYCWRLGTMAVNYRLGWWTMGSTKPVSCHHFYLWTAGGQRLPCMVASDLYCFLLMILCCCLHQTPTVTGKKLGVIVISISESCSWLRVKWSVRLTGGLVQHLQWCSHTTGRLWRRFTS